MSILPNYGLQALTSGELAALAQPTGVRRYLSYIPLSENVLCTAVVASGVAAPPNFVDNAYLSIPFTSGTLPVSGIPIYSTIWIGSQPLTHDIAIVRNRIPCFASPIYTMQISFSDVGLQPGITDSINSFPGSIQSSPTQYITVLKSRNLWQAQPRIVTTPSVQYFKDYDRTWSNDTKAPPPTVNIGPHRSTFVDPGQSYATLTFSITAIIWPGTTSSTLTYTWTLPSGATLVSGTLTGSITNQVTGGTITAQFPVGWQSINLQVTSTNTSSADNLTFAERYIFVHDGTPYAPGPTFPPLPIGSITSDQRDMTGRTMQIQLLTQDSASLTESAFVNVWTVPSFAGGGSVPSLTTQCSGWITTAQFQSEGGLMEADLTIKNSGAVMQAIISKSQRIDIKTTPSNWQEVIPALGTVEYFAYYMLRYHIPNALRLFDFWPWEDPMSNPYLGVGITANAGNEAGQLQEIVKKAFLRWGTDSNGAMWIRAHPSEMYATLRSTNLVIRALMNPAMFDHLDWQQDYQQKVGSVQGEGFQYTGAIDPTSGQNIPTPLLARSPGALTGQGLSEQRLEGQLVPDQSTLQNITGLYYAELNNALPKLNMRAPYNLDIFEPAQQNAFYMDIPGNLSPNGEALLPTGTLAGNWVPTQVNLQDADGTTTVTVVAECQTYGVNGVAIPVPNPVVVGTITPPPPPSTSWTYDIDLTAGAGGWVPGQQSGGLTRAVYSPGFGFVNGGTGLNTECTIAFQLLQSSHITSGWYTLSVSSNDLVTHLTGISTTLILSSVGSDLEGPTYSQPVTPSGVTVNMTNIPYDVTGTFWLFIYNNTNTFVANHVFVTHIHFEGTGVSPFA